MIVLVVMTIPLSLCFALVMFQEFPSLQRHLVNFSARVTNTRILRVMHICFFSFVMTLSSTMKLYICPLVPHQTIYNFTSKVSNSTASMSNSGNGTAPGNCGHPDYVVLTWVLCLIALTSVFKLYFLIKTLLTTVSVVIYCILLVHYYMYYQTKNMLLLPAKMVLLMFGFLVVVVTHARLVEVISRLDFLWRRQVKTDLTHMESIQDMNRRLLAHILPDHVVNHFLSRNWRPDNLYSQQHDEAGVLFACIANFNSIREEDSLKCLRVLNFFILRFDELLLKPEFKCIEKIKTITATYMAASGLDPKHKSEMEEHGHLHALCDYAFALMKALECLPKYSLELRAGISCGPLVGGVIGARKPVYDIWGNTVNEASRMESTGKIRRIQVTNHVQQLLRNRFELKHVAVKGKGMMETWWVMGRKVTSTDTNLCDDPGDKISCVSSEASGIGKEKLYCASSEASGIDVLDSETESDSESSSAKYTVPLSMPPNVQWKLHNFAPEPCGLWDSVQRSVVSNICELSDDSTTPDMRTLGEILFSQDETPEQHPLASLLFSMQQTRQHIHTHPLYSSEEWLADPEVKVS